MWRRRARLESVGAELALSPSQRSAMIYALDLERRDELVRACRSTRSGMFRASTSRCGCATATAVAAEAVIRAAGGARAALRSRWRAQRSARRALERRGRPRRAGRARSRTDASLSPDYPDALARVWSALRCETAGDVLLSAAPGYEFVDWGGADHVGGGSHGSLHRSDSLGALLWCGTGPETRAASEQWSLRDIAPMIREHYQ